MRVQIILLNGENIGIEMSWAEILSGPGKLGEIRIDGDPGVTRIIPKGAIVSVWQFTDDAWKKAKEAADKQVEEQKKTQAEQRKAQVRQSMEQRLAAWKVQPWWKKAFRHCPITLPKDMEAKVGGVGGSGGVGNVGTHQ